MSSMTALLVVLLICGYHTSLADTEISSDESIEREDDIYEPRIFQMIRDGFQSFLNLFQASEDPQGTDNNNEDDAEISMSSSPSDYSNSEDATDYTASKSSSSGSSNLSDNSNSNASDNSDSSASDDSDYNSSDRSNESDNSDSNSSDFDLSDFSSSYLFNTPSSSEEEGNDHISVVPAHSPISLSSSDSSDALYSREENSNPGGRPVIKTCCNKVLKQLDDCKKLLRKTMTLAVKNQRLLRKNELKAAYIKALHFKNKQIENANLYHVNIIRSYVTDSKDSINSVKQVVGDIEQLKPTAKK